MDPATVAAGERSTRGPAPWVFQKVINRPALVVWAAFCDINRRAQIMQSIQTDKTIKATLLSGRMLEAGAVWNMNTVHRWVDSDGDARTSVQNVKYTLVKSVPGQAAVFVYESEPGLNSVGKLRVATFFNELPDGRTEVVEEMTNPLSGIMRNAFFWCSVVITIGCNFLLVLVSLPQIRAQMETGLEAFKGHIETLDAAAWLAGVQADLEAMKAGSSTTLPFLSQQVQIEQPQAVAPIEKVS